MAGNLSPLKKKKIIGKVSKKVSRRAAPKISKDEEEGEGRKRTRESYSSNVYKVLKQVHPES